MWALTALVGTVEPIQSLGSGCHVCPLHVDDLGNVSTFSFFIKTSSRVRAYSGTGKPSSVKKAEYTCFHLASSIAGNNVDYVPGF